MTIGGEQRMGGGERIDVVQPHTARRTCWARWQRHRRRRAAGASRPRKAAAPAWRRMSFDDRAAVFLKAADLLAGPWRDTLNAATMLGQSQDRLPGRDRRGLRADRLLAVQRRTSPGRSCRAAGQRAGACGTALDHRPLEGFVYAITPFNFTAIAGNLPTAPALMGNTVVWKPSPTQQLRAHYHDAAARGGRPAARRDQHGDRATAPAVSEVALRRPATWPASTSPARPATFQHLWRTVGGEHRRLPLLPAARRRDRRQGLRRRPPVRRRRRAAHRADPRRVRVPGPEVLGGLARLRAALAVAAAARRAGRRGRGAADGRRHRLPQLHAAR